MDSGIVRRRRERMGGVMASHTVAARWADNEISLITATVHFACGTKLLKYVIVKQSRILYVLQF